MATGLQAAPGMNRLTFSVSMLVVLAGCQSQGGEPSDGSAPDVMLLADVEAVQPDAVSQSSGLPHPPPCAADEFLFDDKACSPPSPSYPDPSHPSCTQRGDGWCYTTCKQGGTCAGDLSCNEHFLCRGSDYCMDTVYVCDKSLEAALGAPCRTARIDDCEAPATCSLTTSSDCGDASTCNEIVCHL